MKTYLVPCDPQPGAQLEQPESISNDDLIQASFQQLKKPPSPLRPRLLQDMVQQLMLPRGRLSLLTGQAGQGKTAFLVRISSRAGGRAEELRGRGRETVCMLKCKRVLSCPMQASLVSALQAPQQPNVPPLVFFHFSAARPDQCLALNLLRRLCTYLHRKLQEPSALPSSYRCVPRDQYALLPSLLPHL